MKKNMSKKIGEVESENVKNEFRRVYKEYVLKTKGVWTSEDSDELEKQIRAIENNATLISCFLGCAIYAVIVLIAYGICKLAGWM